MEKEILGAEPYEVNREALAETLGHNPDAPEFWRVEQVISSAIRDAELRGWQRGFAEGKECL